MASAGTVESTNVSRRLSTHRSSAYWVSLLLVFATVSWRPDTFYAGGFDPVVIAKALLSGLALSMAWNARLRCTQPQLIRTRAIWFVLAYLAIATFGAWSTGDLVPSAVLAMRVLIIAVTVMLLARSFGREALLRAWLGALATVGVLAGVTGLPSLATGRLRGGVPPLHPNEVATLCALPAVGLVWLVLQGRARPSHVSALVVLLTLVWFTGSRTSLLAAFVAMGAMAVQARRLSRPTLVAVVGLVCALVYVVVATNVLDAFFFRGGVQNVTTFSSRTIAWSAAFSFSDSDWVRWMGAGLATKEIPVEGQYWLTQVLDSSWVSALVQAGRTGVIMLAVWSLSVVGASLTERREPRMAFTGILSFVLLLSFLQSGLVDSAPSFITLFLVGSIAGAAPTATPRRHVPRSAAAIKPGSPAGRAINRRALPLGDEKG